MAKMATGLATAALVIGRTSATAVETRGTLSETAATALRRGKSGYPVRVGP